MILLGSLPLADGDVRNEMTYLLLPGWDSVIVQVIVALGLSTEFETVSPIDSKPRAALT
jgi:hypothetical protein